MKENIQLAIIVGIIVGILCMAGMKETQSSYINDAKKTEFHMALEDSVAIAFERETEQ